MGAYLSAPITEKELEDGENDLFAYAAASMQGWRVDMEDDHFACMDASDLPGKKSKGIFGVFDGHGGKEVARFCARHMLEVWRSTESLKEAEEDIPKSLVEAYLKMDEVLLLEESSEELKELAAKPAREGEEGSSLGEDGDQMVSKVQIKQLLTRLRENMNTNSDEGGDSPENNGEEASDDDAKNAPDAMYQERATGPSAGCTAVVAVVAQGELIVANAGDSRCVASRGGDAVAMSRDHKPNSLDESERIRRAGGFVTDGRVNGSLNLSRAIGDMDYKQRKDLKPEEHAVTAYPEVWTTPVDMEDEFIVLACDGIWDVLSNQEVVDFVRTRLHRGVPLKTICEKMCDRCLAPNTGGMGKGCDNMTIMIVQIKDPIRGPQRGRKMRPTKVFT